MAAHAAVNADGEGQYGLARAVEIHLEGVWEDIGVEVAGGQHTGDAIALLHLDTTHLDVLGDHASREGYRPTSQQLLDNVVDVVGPGDDLLAALRVLGEPQPDVVERREDGVQPADEEEDHEAEDFFLTQRFAIRRSMGDAADHAVIRVCPLLRDRLLDVGDDVLHGLAHGLAIMSVQQVDRPLHEGVAHVLGQAHDVEEYADRQRSTEVSGELAPAFVHDLIEQVPGPLADLAFEVLHAPRAEQW